MWHTLLFTLLSTPPLVLLALGLALLVSRVARGQWVFRLAFFAPFVLPVSVVVLIWNWLYQPDFGLINSYLNSLGLGQVNWLGQPFVAMVSVVIATVWWTVGFNFVLYLAGLQEIPRELYEAAATDGATAWQQTRRITVPLLRTTTIMVVMLQVIASLKVFDQIYLLQNGTAGPNNSTRPAIQYIYETGFTSYRLGYARRCRSSSSWPSSPCRSSCSGSCGWPRGGRSRHERGDVLRRRHRPAPWARSRPARPTGADRRGGDLAGAVRLGVRHVAEARSETTVAPVSWFATKESFDAYRTVFGTARSPAGGSTASSRPR